MTRTVSERIADVRRWLAAARSVYAERAGLAPAIERSTGLTAQGVELGFSCLEREASDDELRALVGAAGDAEHVHVILAANVFVAPLRALALARAASCRVTVRPSDRDPTLTGPLIAAAGDPAIELTAGKEIPASADEVHVYGRDETIAAVREGCRSHPRVRGHGAGLGVAMVTAAANLQEQAERLALDVVPFDQRGCLSPRIVLVEGNLAHAETFALALHERLRVWDTRVPRGALSEAERAAAVRWSDSLAFAGARWGGGGHAIGLAPAGSPLSVPPSGRHVHVCAVGNLEDAKERLAPVARFVVSVGTDDPGRVRSAVPAHARLATLGLMQHPPLDGPVDRRDR